MCSTARVHSHLVTNIFVRIMTKLVRMIKKKNWNRHLTKKLTPSRYNTNEFDHNTNNYVMCHDSSGVVPNKLTV